MTARRGDRPAALAGLRLRRLISFLKRHRLYRTAHALERETGVFDAEHLRRMMLHERWAAASSYSLSFVNVRDCSREADVLNYRILILRVLAALAAGQGRFVDGLFRRIYSYAHVFQDCDGIRRLLLSMRSDNTKSSILYRRIKPKAVEDIMDLVAKCPELKAKTRLPRSTFNPAYIMSLGPRLWQHSTRHTNRSRSIPGPGTYHCPFLCAKKSHTTNKSPSLFSTLDYSFHIHCTGKHLGNVHSDSVVHIVIVALVYLALAFILLFIIMYICWSVC